MPTDDLRRRVALDPLCSGIPGGHVAEWVELKDRVIDHGLDQLAIAPLPIEKLFMGSLTFGNVSRDLGAADHFTGLIADGLDDDRWPETVAVLADPPSFGAD